MEDAGMKGKKWAVEVKKEEENVLGRGAGGGREVAVLILLLSLLSLLFTHRNTPFPILEVIPYYYLYANKIPAPYEFWVMIYMNQNTPKNVCRGIKFFTLLEFKSKNMRMPHIKQLNKREESQTKHTEHIY